LTTVNGEVADSNDDGNAMSLYGDIAISDDTTISQVGTDAQVTDMNANGGEQSQAQQQVPDQQQQLQQQQQQQQQQVPQWGQWGQWIQPTQMMQPMQTMQPMYQQMQYPQQMYYHQGPQPMMAVPMAGQMAVPMAGQMTVPMAGQMSGQTFRPLGDRYRAFLTFPFQIILRFNA
jgi:hypothetical protein